MKVTIKIVVILFFYLAGSLHEIHSTSVKFKSKLDRHSSVQEKIKTLKNEGSTSVTVSAKNHRDLIRQLMDDVSDRKERRTQKKVPKTAGKSTAQKNKKEKAKAKSKQKEVKSERGQLNQIGRAHV